jgi:hypothetical protein
VASDLSQKTQKKPLFITCVSFFLISSIFGHAR